MSARISGVVVTFEDDISAESMEVLTAALRCFRGVIDVRPVEANFETGMGEERARHRLIMSMFDLLHEAKKPGRER